MIGDQARLWFSRVHWKYNWRCAVGSFLSALGVTMSLSTFGFRYLPEQLATAIVGHWWVVIGPAVAWSVKRSWPVRQAEYRLELSDTRMAIRVDDILNVEGAIIVGTNTTFDTSISKGIISPESLQGQFTCKYYDAEEHLDSDLKMSLEHEESTFVEGDRKGNNQKYANGTVAKLEPRGRVAYWVAISDMNEHGVASSSRDQVLEALGKLWQYISERGDLGELAIPVLGTGRARIRHTRREDMVREIINSFIAASSESRFCVKLTIVIADRDYREQQMNLRELGRYLEHCCRYTHLRDATGDAAASPLEPARRLTSARAKALRLLGVRP